VEAQPALSRPGVQRGIAALSATARRAWSRRAKLRLVPSLVNARLRLRSAERLGPRTTLRGVPAIVTQGRLTIGNHVRLLSTVATLELVTLPDGHLEIGDDTFINYGTSIVASNHVRIGKGCLLGTHVIVMDCDFHRVEDKSWDTNGRPIEIEDRVWIGNRAMVLKGVRVGHDAVVAAGAVVTHDVPPRTIVAGVPARVIRTF